MCAIVGLAAKEFGTDERDVLKRLMEQSRVRGLHAFGLSWLNPYGQLQTERYLDFAQAHESVDTIETGPEPRILFHARYSTSGDYRVLENNQPLRLDDTALAFNGVLHMGTKAEMEAELGEAMLTDNDGEMFIRRLDRGEDPVNIVQRGSFSGVWLRKGLLCALTNGRRPAWVLSNYGIRIALSTRDIALRAGLGSWTQAPLPVNEVTEIRP